FSAQRYSIATFSPSIKPASFRPWRKARSRSASVSGDAAWRNPTTGTVGCCARAASGHAAAAPPRRVMNSHRFHVDFALPLIASPASACHPASLIFIRATSIILPSATMRSASLLSVRTALVLHERLQKLPPFTLRLTAFTSYHTCNWRTFSRTASKDPILLVVVEIE